jgi:hypothetical protein
MDNLEMLELKLKKQESRMGMFHKQLTCKYIIIIIGTAPPRYIVQFCRN